MSSSSSGSDDGVLQNGPQMSCCVSTTKGSAVGVVTGTLTTELQLHQLIKIRNELFHIHSIRHHSSNEGDAQTMNASGTTGTTTVTFSSPSVLHSCNGMIPRFINTCTPLVGVDVHLKSNSTTVETVTLPPPSPLPTAAAVENVLHAGDQVAFDVGSWQTFEIDAGGVTALGFDLKTPWFPRQSASTASTATTTTTLFKCGSGGSSTSRESCDPIIVEDGNSGGGSGGGGGGDGGGGATEETSCSDVVMTKNEKQVQTFCDLRAKIDLKDEILLCGIVYTVVHIEPLTLTLNQAWLGRTNDISTARTQQCTMCRRPRSETQVIMQAYQEKYGKCDSVLCMARLEAEERKIGVAVSKEMTTTTNSVVQMEKEEEEEEEKEDTPRQTQKDTHDTSTTRLQHKSTPKVGDESSLSNLVVEEKPSSGTRGKESGSSSTSVAPSLPAAPASSPFGDLSLAVPVVHLGADGSVQGGLDERDEDTPLLNAIKGPLANLLKTKLTAGNAGGGDIPEKKLEEEKEEQQEKVEKKNEEKEEEEEEEEEDGLEDEENEDEDGIASDSEQGDATPSPPSKGTDGKLPKHEKDPAFEGWKKSKVPPGSSKSFKRFLNCELCGADNDVLNPLLMVNPTNEPPMSNEEYMKKKTKAAETVAAQSTPPGYLGAPNKPWHAAATEGMANANFGIKFCPDDWLDLGVGEHIYPIDPENPVGHKCQNLLNLGKCKEPKAIISDLAVAQGVPGPPGIFVEDFSQKKCKTMIHFFIMYIDFFVCAVFVFVVLELTPFSVLSNLELCSFIDKGYFGKSYKCQFARECRTPWLGFDHLCGVKRWWLKQTEQNSFHTFNDANGAETPVKWPE